MTLHETCTTILMGIWPLADLNSVWMELGVQSAKISGQKKMLQLLVIKWDTQDLVMLIHYLSHTLYTCESLGALVGNQRFRDSGADSLISQHLNCNGTEDHLRQCIGPVGPTNTTLVSRCEDVLLNVYVVCQGR